MSPITPVAIEKELSASYLDYAMSVIVSRALPDVRDGLKPVQRRILYVMSELGLLPDKPYKKCARIVGDTLGKFHPHGDAPVYETLVRLAQDFTMRYPLIDGQGNFGSIDDDPPAAMRYTEARLTPIALEMLADIDKGIVDFVPNFDGSLKEPSVLPAKLPNLLVNGCSGIAVGMSTNIPPHNLTEVCHALAFLIDHPNADLAQIMRFIKGPDFPTGGVILGTKGIEEAYRTGQGKLILQAQVQIMERRDKRQIVINQIPYQVSKAAIVEKIADLIKENKIEGIAEIRDESNRQSLRVVVELKRGVSPQIVLNQLYHLTPLRNSYTLNFLVLVNGRPRTVGLIELMHLYLDHRYKVTVRRSQFELNQLKEKAHILEGLKIALENLDRVVAIIKASPNAESAKQKLMKNFPLTPAQAQAILETPLRKLCALEVNRLLEEYSQIKGQISQLEELLNSPQKIWELVKEESLRLAELYKSERRTQICEEIPEISEEELIPSQEVAIAIGQGYIKRLPMDSFRGKQVNLQAEQLTRVNIRDYLMFFTEPAEVYWVKAFQVPETGKGSRGTPISNLLPLKGKKISCLLSVDDFSNAEGKFLLLLTASGKIKKINLGEFGPPHRQGLKAVNLANGDRVIEAAIGNGGDEVILISHRGKALRFPLDSLPLHSRQSQGIIGQRLGEGDRGGFINIVKPGEEARLFLITENGYGMVIEPAFIPVLPAGRQGKRIIEITAKTGPLTGVVKVLPSGRAICITQNTTYIWKVKELPQDRSLILEGERVLSLASLD